NAITQSNNSKMMTLMGDHLPISSQVEALLRNIRLSNDLCRTSLRKGAQLSQGSSTGTYISDYNDNNRTTSSINNNDNTSNTSKAEVENTTSNPTATTTTPTATTTNAADVSYS